VAPRESHQGVHWRITELPPVGDRSVLRIADCRWLVGSAKPDRVQDANSVRLSPTTTATPAGHGAPTVSAVGAASDDSTASASGGGMGTSPANVVR